MQTASGGLFYLCLAGLLVLGAWRAGHAQAAPTLMAGLLNSGLSGKVATVKGEVLELQGLRLKTPTDFDTVPAGQPPFHFFATPEPPDFANIQKIVLSDLSTSWLESQPEAIEYYRLGNVRNAIPPPPDWQRSSNQIPPWSRARATPDPSGLPFLNHARFCWAVPPEDAGKEVGVYLFRQTFAIEQPETIVRATLRLASNVEPLEAALNQQPLHLGNQQAFAIGEFEVTPLMQAGANIFALKVRERPGVPAGSCGVAFHLELLRRAPTARVARPVASAALVTSQEGDRLWGSVQELRGDRVQLMTAYGLYGIEWERCAGLLFPSGWHTGGPNPAPTAAAAVTAESTVWGLPLRLLPQGLQDCMLLTEGRQITAKPAYLKDDQIFYEGSEGKQYALPQAEVLGIYPPRAATSLFARPKPQVATLYGQVTTNSGEVICGLLRAFDARRVVVESSGGQILTVRADQVASIHFPYHAATLDQAGAKGGAVGLMAQVSSRETYRDTFIADARQVQAAAFAIGAECKNVTLEEAASTEQLNAQTYPVLVSVDPVGEYLYTLKAEGDAQKALVGYVEQGGILIALSRGGAFRTAVKAEGGQLVGTTAKPDFCEQMKIKTLRPTDPPMQGISAFDHPPNTTSEFFFQRVGQPSEGLAGLPRRIEMAPMVSSPFYPMLPQQGGGQGVAVYQFCDGQGQAYGPALTIIPKGQGMLMIIDHLLWESRIEGRAFGESVLPVILHRALLSAGQQP